MSNVIVSVKDRANPDRHWGATLINVQYIEGEWRAVVMDNYDESIYVIPATEIKQWGGWL